MLLRAHLPPHILLPKVISKALPPWEEWRAGEGYSRKEGVFDNISSAQASIPTAGSC